jgi:hypothetical protein
VLETDVTFVAPGTYFPVIRVTAGRAGSGDPGVMSLGRMRVVVA